MKYLKAKCVTPKVEVKCP